MYVLWWVPLPLASVWTLLALALLGVLALGIAGKAHEAEGWRRLWRKFRAWPHRISLLGIGLLTLLLFYLEASVAVTQPAGNTLDAANYTFWTALLLDHGHFVLNGAPFVDYPAYQPQGVVVWFASAHLVAGIPLWSSPNETGPIFQALMIPALACVGRKWIGGELAPVVFVALVSLLFAWPLLLVQGSYDFIASLPLAILLLPWLARLLKGTPHGAASPLPVTAAFAFLGTAYSPVPIEALLAGAFATAILLLVVHHRDILRGLRPLAGMTFVALGAFLAVLPTAAAFLGLSSRSSAVMSSPVAMIAPSTLPTYFDPFLFASSDIWYSPFLTLHIEFAVLLLAGVGLLLFGDRLLPSSTPEKVLWSLAPRLFGSAVLLVLMAGSVSFLYTVTNASELALFFGMGLALLAALPVGLLAGGILPFEGAASPASRPAVVQNQEGGEGGPPTVGRGPRPVPSARRFPRSVITAALVVALLIPPVYVTATQDPPYMDRELSSVSSVTSDDVQMMSFIATLPSAPVLVAPGSAGEFLPAFCNDPLLFPLIGLGGGIGFEASFANGSFLFPFQGPASNATYQNVVGQLVTGNLTPSLGSDLGILHVRYVMVTGPSTGLFPPFLPGPLLSEPNLFEPLKNIGPDYVFEVSNTTTPP